MYGVNVELITNKTKYSSVHKDGKLSQQKRWHDSSLKHHSTFLVLQNGHAYILPVTPNRRPTPRVFLHISSPYLSIVVGYPAYDNIYVWEITSHWHPQNNLFGISGITFLKAIVKWDNLEDFRKQKEIARQWVIVATHSAKCQFLSSCSVHHHHLKRQKYTESTNIF